jgi:predicted CoA-binding protein
MGQKVAILGASDNPERYSYKAFRMLREHAHTLLPVSVKMQELEGVPVFKKLGDIREPVDTLTMYVGPQISSGLQEEILALKPKRVIFNPGSENPPLQKALAQAGVHVVEACTLVLLRTGQFMTA